MITSSPDELPWRSTRDEGIHWIDLRRAAGEPWESAEPEDQSMTVLIRMDPGHGYPRHRHLGPEDVLILAGGYRDAEGAEFRAGDFVRYPAGSEHTPVALGDREQPIGPGNPACILFAVAHGGTELSPATPPVEPDTVQSSTESRP